MLEAALLSVQDLLTVERAAAIGCPVEDIAALLGIGRRTLYDHMERDPAVADAIEKGRGTGRATLRRMQWEKAQAGDTSMLIWLGKVMCGQRETSVVAMTAQRWPSAERACDGASGPNRGGASVSEGHG